MPTSLFGVDPFHSFCTSLSPTFFELFIWFLLIRSSCLLNADEGTSTTFPRLALILLTYHQKATAKITTTPNVIPTLIPAAAPLDMSFVGIEDGVGAMLVSEGKDGANQVVST